VIHDQVGLHEKNIKTLPTEFEADVKGITDRITKKSRSTWSFLRSGSIIISRIRRCRLSTGRRSSFCRTF
jgi:hypothetical protein